MPSTATITAFYTFSANTQIKSSEHNANFNNFRGHLIAIDPNTATAAATLTYDLGATDKYWRAGYVGQVNANTVSVSSLVATTATVTTFSGTSINATTIVGTTISGTSIVGTTITATTLVSTSINATTIFGTSITATNLLTDSFSGNTRTVTTTHSLTSSDFIVFADASSGAYTITFPTAASSTKKIYIVKKTDQSINAITLSGTGMTTNYLMTIGETAAFQSDGSNWVQIWRKTETPWQDFTPTGTWVTNATYQGKWRRTGDSIEIQYYLTVAGAPTATGLDFDIPGSSSWTIDTAKLFGSTNHRSLGFLNVTDVNVSGFYGGGVMYVSNTRLRPLTYAVSGVIVGMNSAMSNTAPFTWASGDYLYMRVWPIPITNFSA